MEDKKGGEELTIGARETHRTDTEMEPTNAGPENVKQSDEKVQLNCTGKKFDRPLEFQIGKAARCIS